MRPGAPECAADELLHERMDAPGTFGVFKRTLGEEVVAVKWARRVEGIASPFHQAVSEMGRGLFGSVARSCKRSAACIL